MESTLTEKECKERIEVISASVVLDILEKAGAEKTAEALRKAVPDIKDAVPNTSQITMSEDVTAIEQLVQLAIMGVKHES